MPARLRDDMVHADVVNLPESSDDDCDDNGADADVDLGDDDESFQDEADETDEPIDDEHDDVSDKTTSFQSAYASTTDARDRATKKRKSVSINTTADNMGTAKRATTSSQSATSAKLRRGRPRSSSQSQGAPASSNKIRRVNEGDRKVASWTNTNADDPAERDTVAVRIMTAFAREEGKGVHGGTQRRWSASLYQALMRDLHDGGAYVPEAPAGKSQEKIVRSKYKQAVSNDKIRDKRVVPTEAMEEIIAEEVMGAFFDEWRHYPLTAEYKGVCGQA
jgi:hypothetical protein